MMANPDLELGVQDSKFVGNQLCSPKRSLPSSPAEKLEHRRISDVMYKSFVSRGNKFDVIDIFDHTEGQCINSRQVDDDSATSVACSDPQAARIRIISISSSGSIWPLNITYETACRIWEHYDLEHEFRDIICTFGTAPNAGRGGATNGFVKSSESGATTCAYALQYFEENERSKEMPWSQRQTAIYHRHIPNNSGSLGDNPQPLDFFILLNSTRYSHFASEIASLVHTDETVRMSFYTRLVQNPLLIHETLLQTCMSDWMWYLRSKGSEFQETTDQLFATSNPKTQPQALDFEPFRNMRQDRDDILAAVAFCHGTSDVLGLLNSFRTHLDKPDNDWFETARKQIKGHWNGLSSLLSRVENALALLQYSLDLKASALSSDMNRNMVDMTSKTVELTRAAHTLARKSADDSAAIRIITILTLIYLPGTFISGIFGTNFFDFNADSPRDFMDIARNFWIYIVLWVPLTMMTIGLYLYFNWRRKRDLPPPPTGQERVFPSISGQSAVETMRAPTANNFDIEKVGRPSSTRGISRRLRS